MMQNEKIKYWDSINEYEIDETWRTDLSDEYKRYREQFDLASRGEYEGKFPLSIEVELSYHCNLTCPSCPRIVNIDTREKKHINPDLWKLILAECKENELPAILMDHEAESLMNPKLPEYMREAKEAGIFDIWLHTNANLLTRRKAEELIDAGLTKINFSVDAVTSATYDKVRPGGNYEKVVRNIINFLSIKIEKKASYLRTRVSFVVQPENKFEKKAFFDFWKNQKGLNIIVFQDMIDYSVFQSGNGEKIVDKRVEEKLLSKNFFCSQPWEMPIIDVDGNVYPCGTPIEEKDKDFILGNLLNGDTIASCWNGRKMQELRNLHKNNLWYKNEVCRKCMISLHGCDDESELVT